MLLWSWIADSGLDVSEQVFSHMKASHLEISLQLDKTAIVLNCCHLLHWLGMSMMVP